MEKFTMLVYLSTVAMLFKHLIEPLFEFYCTWNGLGSGGYKEYELRVLTYMKCACEFVFSLAIFLFLTDYLYY